MDFTSLLNKDVIAIGVILLVTAGFWGVQKLPALSSLKLSNPFKKSSDVSAAAAFDATQLLMDYFKKAGCTEGLNAAREAGKCLFHEPGEKT